MKINAAKWIAILAILVLSAFISFLLLQRINPHQAIQRSNSTKSLVPYNQIVSGGPPPDGIPSIDNPNFVTASNATFLSNSSIIIGINLNGQAKAYPLLILVWHEIVNDNLGGTPIAITYCPLCYSSIAFIRRINGATVQFGTSGKLYNNNLVMYDRLTKSLWSQILGEAIEGNLSGYVLQRVPIDVIPWGVWKRLYPNTLVLSENTGFSRPYGTDPYGNYYTSPGVYFPLNHIDNRLQAKTIIQGLSINGVNKAYPILIFNKSLGVINDNISNHSVVFFVYSNNVTRAFDAKINGKNLNFKYLNGNFTDTNTGSIWNFNGTAVSGSMEGKNLNRIQTTTMFWFAWSAFYPNTQIYNFS